MARQITMTPDQFAKEWQGRMTGSVTKIQEGVSRLQENPMAKAAQNKDAWVQGIMNAANSGRWENSLAQVDFATWKNVTRQKVGERLAGGAQAAVPKMQKFGQYLIPTVNAAVQGLDGMPKLTLQDNINRMVKFVSTMAANPYKG